jgi:hypothetical protein
MALETSPNGVIAFGSSGTNYWVLYADRTLIKYGSYALTVNIGNTWGGVITSAPITYTFNTTIPFTTVPSVYISTAHATSTTWTAYNTVTALAVNFQLCRGSIANLPYTILYRAIGRG